MATKNTPILNAKGQFKLKLPWASNPKVTYECIAIRTFRDCATRGENVLEKYYQSNGLDDGVTINGGIFVFDDEVKAGACIVTLLGSDDTMIYVPDTYIEAYPSNGLVGYSTVILSALLGSLPDTLPLDTLVAEVEQVIGAKFGIKPMVNISAIVSKEQPTVQEHENREQARIGAIKDFSNTKTQLTQALEDNKTLTMKVNSLINYIRNKGFLDDLLHNGSN